jgi:hypothetical protein
MEFASFVANSLPPRIAKRETRAEIIPLRMGGGVVQNILSRAATLSADQSCGAPVSAARKRLSLLFRVTWEDASGLNVRNWAKGDIQRLLY